MDAESGVAVQNQKTDVTRDPLDEPLVSLRAELGCRRCQDTSRSN